MIITEGLKKVNTCQFCGGELLENSIYSYERCCPLCFSIRNVKENYYNYLDTIPDSKKSGYFLPLLDSSNTFGENKKNTILSRFSKVHKRDIKYDCCGKVKKITQIEYPSSRQNEIIRVSKPYLFGLRPPQFSNQVANISNDVSLSTIEASASRRRGKIKRTIDVNLKKRNNRLGFLTLTFKAVLSVSTGFKKVKSYNPLPDILRFHLFSSFGLCPVNVIEKGFSLEQLNKFIKRLRYYGNSRKNLNFSRYVWVKEYQKNGRPHFHILFFDWKFLKHNVLQEIWGKGSEFNGYVSINKIASVKRVGKYISKYLGKADSYIKNDRLWSCSRNCEKIIRICLEHWQYFTGKVFNWYFEKFISGDRIRFFYRYETWLCDSSAYLTEDDLLAQFYEDIPF